MAFLRAVALGRPCVLLARKLTPSPLLFVKNLASSELSQGVTFIRPLQGFGRSGSSESEWWKTKDEIPPPFELIYHLRMHSYVTFAHLVGSLASLLVGYVLVQFYSPSEPIPKFDVRSINKDLRSIKNEEMVYFGGFLFFITCLFMIVHKLPHRVYHWPERGQYIFVKSGWLPYTRTKFGCDIKDVYYDKNGRDLFLWGNSSYSIKNRERKVVLLDNSFRLPSDINTLQGLQRSQCDDDDDEDN